MKNTSLPIRFFFCLVSIVLSFGLLQLPTLLSSSDHKSIQVFAWGDYFSYSDIIEDFEKKTGIKVTIHSYESNEEMYVKLLANPKGYDIIFPSDYAIRLLKEKKLLKKIDHSRLNFLDKIHPSLLGHPYDKENAYSIPNTWETFSIAIDKIALKQDKIPFDLAAFFYFPNIDYKFCMTPDPTESIVLASYYLYKKVDHLSKKQAEEVKELLIKQKPFVEAYADCRAKYLIQTKNCPIAFERSSYAWQIIKENPSLDFMEFNDVVFTSIENVALPKDSNKDDLVYAFINYLYEPSVHAKLTDLSSMYPVIAGANQYTEQPPAYFTHFEECLKRRDEMVFFSYLVSEEETRNIWIDLKSK